MEDAEHTTRLTENGFVVCVCGWATAAVDQDPKEAAAAHVAATALEDGVASWVERPGGTVCVPQRSGT